MNLTLQNDNFFKTGIFGTLFNADRSFVLQTLQHAYAESPEQISYSSSYRAKIPPGVYTCVRGIHQLDATKISLHPKPFETFEITGVEGHTDLLFHVGNQNSDSAGCILLGKIRQHDMILESKVAFDEFMKLQEGCNTFFLTVA